MIIFKKNIESLEFTSDDSHIKTLRPKLGAILRLTNLEGSLYTIEVINYNFKSGKGNYKIIKHTLTPKPKSRTIIQSVIDKNYLDKLFEIVPIANITDVILVESEYSNVPNINLGRLESIMIRACEQSENVFKPSVQLIVKQKLTQYLHTESIVATVLELPEKNSNQLETKLDTIIVGPEGGFSDNEIDYFVKNNYPFYSIKCNVLPAWLAGFSYYLGI